MSKQKHHGGGQRVKKGKRDHYATLGVAKDADTETIKQAYRKKAKEAHPDTGGGHEEFLELQLAWHTLGDQESREHYDETGEDAGQPRILDRAKQMLCQFLIEAVVMVGTVEIVDLLELIGGRVKATMEKQRELIASLPDKAKTLRSVADRVIAKNDGENYLANSMHNAAVAAENQIDSLKRELETYEEVLKQLEGFTYRTDDPSTVAPETMSRMFENIFGATIGRAREDDRRREEEMMRERERRERESYRARDFRRPDRSW